MGKRAAPSDDGSSAKRQKVEEIHTARELQSLLIFQQDAPQLRHGIQSLKTFLDSILYPTNPDDVPRRRAILREYLEFEKPRNTADKDVIYLSSLIRAWDYAGQTNNEHLQAAVIAVLALLLKTISADLEAREYGALVCRTILQSSQLKLIYRGLIVDKHKDHIISPCLRLLTEVVSFDGGAFARQVYNRRDQTFDNRVMIRILGIRSDKVAEGKRKPSVRTNAIKYLLANFIYQSEGVKIDILKQYNICNTLFHGIQEDDPGQIKNVLGVIKNHVLLDNGIPKSSKHHLLTEKTLSNIASLYRVPELPSEDSADQKALDVTTHEFLLLVVNSSEAGALIPNCGWYPPGTDKGTPDAEEEKHEEDVKIDLGLDSIEWYRRFNGRVPVRNTILSGFAQSLKPYSNEFERELLLAVFKAAPELVADYFFKKSTFSFDPKLTLTWIGYSSFLFETVQLPLPRDFGRASEFDLLPPPVSIVIENILPQPLSQKVLTRCLNQSSELITFFAIRIIIIAFQKLQLVLQQFSQASRSAPRPALWIEASERILSAFRRRCPAMKDVILTFRRLPDEKIMEREAIARLLALYYDNIPEVALAEKFDVGIPLVKALLPTEKPGTEEHEMRLVELSHLLRVAQHSPNMRWFHKPEALPFSPFVTLLKMAADSKGGSSNQMKQLLVSIVRENDILQTETTLSSLDALVASFCTHNVDAPVLEFVDNCASRVAQKAIKYLDHLDDILAKHGENSQVTAEPSSLLTVAIAEQWSFAAKVSQEDSALIAEWIATFFNLLKQVGENETVLADLCSNMADAVEEQSRKSVFKKALKYKVHSDVLEAEAKSEVLSNGVAAEPQQQSEPLDGNKVEAFEDDKPPVEDEDHPALNRWIQKEVEDAVDDGIVEDLVLYLCSQHLDIRRQAVQALRKFLAKVDASDYENKGQLWLLLGELLETVSQFPDDGQPLPYMPAAFAFHAVKIVADPLHVLYRKVNRFLNRGPAWTIDRLPSYWADKIILNPPDEDDAYHKEVTWLLDFFIDALRTPADMEIFRKRNTFERVLVLYDSAFVSSKGVREKVLRLLFRAAAVGGSTTLITRSGVVGWVEAQVARKDGYEGSWRRLARRLYESCDKERVDAWSKGGMSRVVDGICPRVVNGKA